jgi:hypothetical protein
VGCRYQHVRREEDVSYHPRGTDKGRRPKADVFLFVAHQVFVGHQVMKRTEVLFGQSDLRASERPPNIARQQPDRRWPFFSISTSGLLKGWGTCNHRELRLPPVPI